MIPILMIVFALGGTTFGMAEESLAFYALIITVMIAAGYDSLVGAVDPAARLRHRRPRLDHQPVRDRHRLGVRRRVASSEGIVGRLVILVVGTAIGIVFVMRYAARVKADPSQSLVADQARRRTRRTSEAGRRRGWRRRRRADRPAEGRPRPVRPRLRGDDLRRHPVGGPGHRALPTLWWWFPEMTASFLLFAILIGVVGRMAESELHDRPSSTARGTCWASR